MDVQKFVPLEVAFVTFKPQVGQRTWFHLEEVVDMDEEELQRRELAKEFDKYFIGPPAFNHFMWYSKALRLELSSIGPGRKLRVTHLRVESGVQCGFMHRNTLYHALTIIVGPIEEHFYFVDAVNFQARCGSRFRPHLEALARSSVLARTPSTYQKCPKDFCANNCQKCRSSADQGFCPCNGKSFLS